jgi:hypothetical protein
LHEGETLQTFPDHAVMLGRDGARIGLVFGVRALAGFSAYKRSSVKA